MTRSNRRGVGRAAPTGEIVQVVEEGGVRSLYLGSDVVQSAMRVSDPAALELSYTRAMAAFLLFHETPRRFLMIGLGGGSFVKFAYHRFPEATITVVEHNPRVIEAARDLFFVPVDDARLSIVLADGAGYARRHRRSCDVLVLDAFDADGQPEALASEAFYRDALAALDADGVLVANLAGASPRIHDNLSILHDVFEGRVLRLPADTGGNVAAFAFRGPVAPLTTDALHERALRLSVTSGVALDPFVDRLAARFVD
jgi:spermidine synthase